MPSSFTASPRRSLLAAFSLPASCLGWLSPPYTLLPFLSGAASIPAWLLLHPEHPGERAHLTCMIFLLIVGSNIFNVFIAVSKIPLGISTFVAGLAVPPIGIVA